MKQNHALSTMIGILILISSARATASAASEVIDRIVAVVNEDIILLSELKDRMAPYRQRLRQQGFAAEQEKKMLYQVREEMLNRLVDEKLTDQEVERYGIKIDSEEIDSTIERIKAANSFTDEDLREHLDQENATMDEYRERIRHQILRTRLVNYQVKSKIVITDEEVQTYYDGHPEIYGGKRRYHLKNILIRVPAYSTDAEKEAAREKTEQIRSQIMAGEDFSETARTYSQGPTAMEGGDIGAFEEGTLSLQIVEALDGLAEGEVTEVLDTEPGFQLFFVESIQRLESIPLETVKPEIREKLFAEVVDKKFLSWLEDLRDRSHIKIVN